MITGWLRALRVYSAVCTGVGLLATVGLLVGALELSEILALLLLIGAFQASVALGCWAYGNSRTKVGLKALRRTILLASGPAVLHWFQHGIDALSAGMIVMALFWFGVSFAPSFTERNESAR